MRASTTLHDTLHDTLHQTRSRLPVTGKVSLTARDLHSQQTSLGTLHRVLLLATELIGAVDDAGVSQRQRSGELQTTAASSDRCARADQLQLETGDGPCYSAVGGRDVVSATDIGSDERWGAWGPRASAETGLHSMLCFRLFTNEDGRLGALNLYAAAPHAFTSADVEFGRAFAAQAAVHLARSRTYEHLETALSNRSRISEAVGILMERYDLSSERAFETLARLSSTSNTKLRDVAAELVRTREIPSPQAVPRDR